MPENAVDNKSDWKAFREAVKAINSHNHGDPRALASFGQRMLAESLKQTALEIEGFLDVGPMTYEDTEKFKKRLCDLVDAIAACDPSTYEED